MRFFEDSRRRAARLAREKRARLLRATPSVESLDRLMLLSISAIVTNTNASGPGSLAAAIAGDQDIITFAITGGATETINGQTVFHISGTYALPYGVYVNGSSESSYSTNPVAVDGLTISSTASYVTLNNLWINNLSVQSSHDTIQGNHVDQISLDDSDYDTIGGTGTGQGNIIGGGVVGSGDWLGSSGGATYAGIVLTGSDHNTIVGNTITGPAGASGADYHFGIVLADGSASNTIGGTTTSARNVISGDFTTGEGSFGAGTSYGAGILLTGGATSNTVEGDWIGTADGATAAPNDYGIILSGATNNTIGGTATGAANVISGNVRDGVLITGPGSTGNTATGNTIGTNPAGTAALANGGAGVEIAAAAASNTIGGTATGAANVISGNTSDGVRITGSGTSSNSVVGDLIGTNAAGTAAIANGGFGVLISAAATSNLIGGTAAGSANTISGNTAGGLALRDSGTSSNNVQGNRIGTNAAGTAALGNAAAGILIAAGASSNTVGGTSSSARNVISGNLGGGVVVTGSGTSTNIVSGNDIGVDSTGAAALANTGFGVVVGASATGNTIGGTTSGAGNVISGNTSGGVSLTDTGTSNNTVAGNLIGTNAGGTQALGNAVAGVVIASQASNNVIGGTTATSANTISGNLGYGVEVTGSGTTGNTIEGNLIGTTPDGTAALANSSVGVYVAGGASGNTIGGASSSARNVVSGNTGVGVELTGSGTSNNAVAGNYIGTNKAGTAAVGNGGFGVLVAAAAATNTIGGAAGAGNVISGNGAGGVEITGSGTTGNSVSGNLVGTDAAGTAALANGVAGILVMAGASGNTVGGTLAASRNLVSGNNGYGVELSGTGTTGNTVEGNYIGINAAGTAALGNGSFGVIVSAAAATNTIGGSVPGAGNVVSGNAFGGIEVTGTGTTGVTVAGNLVGTNAAGTAALANGVAGILVMAGASGNTVGGTLAASRNLVSGNNGYGVELSGTGTTGNTVEGNYIGTNAAGTAALGNTSYGVLVSAAANANTIGGAATGAGDVISGNLSVGVEINGASGNFVQGDLIGTTADGSAALANATIGLLIKGGAASNTVGGTVAGARNVISGNTGANVSISDAGTSGNVVEGNDIGLNAAGTAPFATSTAGVYIANAASGNIIGGGSAAARNVISGDVGVGLEITGAGTTANLVEGNYIGTDPSGDAAIGDLQDGVLIVGGASGNTIGGPDSGDGNVISGNGDVSSNMFASGVEINGAGTSGNVVAGNFIGINAHGTAALGNARAGVRIDTGASGNIIGGTTAGARNVISGNFQDGIDLYGSGTSGNVVAGNYIGTDIAGEAALGNSGHGILVFSGATGNTIGGTTAGARNVISGNVTVAVSLHDAGTSGNVVEGNYIGTDAAGEAAIGNHQDAVQISLGASGNTIGGTTLGAGNVISGNFGSGVYLSGTSNNLVAGNYIGTDAEGETALGNSVAGIAIGSGATGNLVGGTTEYARNVISGNLSNGVQIVNAGTSGNLVEGNIIGLDADGTAALGNLAIGVVVASSASGNTIGGTDPGAGNVIADNGRAGVVVGSPITDTASGNAILGNSIFGNARLGIDLGDDGVTANSPGGPHSGPNHLQNTPVLSTAGIVPDGLIVTGTLSGAANTMYRVEFFASPTADPSGYGEGQVYLDFTTVTTDGTGQATFAATLKVDVAPGQFISATATDPDGNTSEFAHDVVADTIPVAIDDAYSIGHDKTLTVGPNPFGAAGILFNDHDDDGDALTAVLVDDVQHGTLVPNANGTFTYTPDPGFAGTDSFTYRASDGTIASDPATVTLTVTEAAPVAVGDAYRVSHDRTLTVSPSSSGASGVLFNDTDPDGDTLTASLVDNVQHGSLTFQADGSFTYTPNAGFTGNDSFTYRASDGSLTSDATTVTLTVVETAPLASPATYTAKPGQTLNVATGGVLAKDADAEGDDLTAVLVADVQHGSLSLNADGTFAYTPNAGFTGTDSFTYQASDGILASVIAAVTINVAESAPVAVDDQYVDEPGEVLDVTIGGVLANDTDAEGYPLTAVLVTDAGHGTLTLGPDGTFTYLPNTGFTGTDSFTYQTSDGTLVSNEATVTIEVDTQIPTAVADTYTAVPGQPFVVGSTDGVLANDTDADDDPLTAVLVMSPQHGALTLNPDGGFGYTPAAGFTGEDSFTYQAVAGTQTSQVTTVTITVVGKAAVAEADTYSTGAGQTLVTPIGQGVQANDENPAGKPLTTTVTTTVLNGTLVITPDGLFSYTPRTGFWGTDTFTYVDSDGALYSNSATVSITVVSPFPIPLDPTPSSSVPPGTTNAASTAFGPASSNSSQSTSNFIGTLSTEVGFGGLTSLLSPTNSITDLLQLGFHGVGSQATLLSNPNSATYYFPSAEAVAYFLLGSTKLDTSGLDYYLIEYRVGLRSPMSQTYTSPNGTWTLSATITGDPDSNNPAITVAHVVASYSANYTRSVVEDGVTLTETATSWESTSLEVFSEFSNGPVPYVFKREQSSSNGGSYEISQSGTREDSGAESTYDLFTISEYEGSGSFTEFNPDGSDWYTVESNGSSSASNILGISVHGNKSFNWTTLDPSSGDTWANNGTEDYAWATLASQTSGTTYSENESPDYLRTVSSSDWETEYDSLSSNLQGQDAFNAILSDPTAVESDTDSGLEDYFQDITLHHQNSEQHSTSYLMDADPLLGPYTSYFSSVGLSSTISNGDAHEAFGVEGELSSFDFKLDSSTGEVDSDVGSEDYAEGADSSVIFGNMTSDTSNLGSGDLQGDSSSQALDKTHLSSHVDSGSDTSFEFTHGTDSGRFVPAGEASGRSSDDFSDFESTSDQYTDNSGVTDTTTTLGTISNSSTSADQSENTSQVFKFAQGTDSSTEVWADGETDSASDSYSDVENSSEQYSTDLTASRVVSDGLVTASTTDVVSDSDFDSSSDQETDTDSDLLEGGGSDSSSDTDSTDDVSRDRYSDQLITIENGPVGSTTTTTAEADSDSHTETYDDQGTQTESDAGGGETDYSSTSHTEHEESSDWETDDLLTTTSVVDGTTYSSTGETDSGSSTDSDFYRETDSASTSLGDETDTDSSSLTDHEWSGHSFSDHIDTSRTTSGTEATVSTSGTSTDSDFDFWSEDGGETETDNLSDESEADVDTDTYSDWENSGGQSTDSFSHSESASGGSISATLSDSVTESSSDTASHHEHHHDTMATGIDWTSHDVTEDDNSIDQHGEGDLVLASDLNGETTGTTTDSHTDNDTETSHLNEFGSFSDEMPTDSGVEDVWGTFTKHDDHTITDIVTALEILHDHDGVTTGTEVGTETEIETDFTSDTTHGEDAFDGVSGGDDTYSGTGSFSVDGSDSTSTSTRDTSNLTIRGDGLLDGDEWSTTTEDESWSDSRHDEDDMAPGGPTPESVTLSSQDSGNQHTDGSNHTIVTAGLSSDQGTTTLRTSDTQTFSENDSQSSYSETEIDNTTSTTPTGPTGAVTTTGSPVTTQTGTQTPAFVAAETIATDEDEMAGIGVLLPQVPSSNGSNTGPIEIKGSTDIARIPLARVEGMVNDGLARNVDTPNGTYVYIADPVPGGGFVQILLKRNVWAVGNNNLGQPVVYPDNTYRIVYTYAVAEGSNSAAQTLQGLRTQSRASMVASAYETELAAGMAVRYSGVMEFAFSSIPGVETGNQINQGNFGAATLSFFFDALDFSSGFGILGKAAKGVIKIPKAGKNVLSLTRKLATFDSDMRAFIVKGAAGQADGAIGEAILKLLGMKADDIAKMKKAVGVDGSTVTDRLRSLLDDYWNHSGGITVDEARTLAKAHGFNFELGRISRFENARNSVVVAKADLRSGEVNRILLAEEIQHGLDRATNEASKAIRRGLTNEQFHAQLFQRIVDGYAAGKFQFLTADDIAALRGFITRLGRR